MSAIAKAEVLHRIRLAIGADPVVPDIPRGYRMEGGYDRDQLCALLTDRLLDYRAQVIPCAPDTIADTVVLALREQVVASVVAPNAAAEAWLTPSPEGILVELDRPDLTAPQLAEIDAVVTGCALAIAETGVIVLDGGPMCGRRAASLVPDVHVCVVTADQVVGLPPEAISQLDPSMPQTWIAGPSATSDIELSRVEGVHGPRTLIVVLAA